MHTCINYTVFHFLGFLFMLAYIITLNERMHYQTPCQHVFHLFQQLVAITHRTTSTHPNNCFSWSRCLSLSSSSLEHYFIIIILILLLWFLFLLLWLSFLVNIILYSCYYYYYYYYYHRHYHVFLWDKRRCVARFEPSLIILPF